MLISEVVAFSLGKTLDKCWFSKRTNPSASLPQPSAVETHLRTEIKSEDDEV